MDTETDIHFCLRKILKSFVECFVAHSIKHPFIPFSISLVFFLYMLFPLVLWSLIHLFPLVICIIAIIITTFSKRKKEENDTKLDDSKTMAEAAADHSHNAIQIKKRVSRVHSVRQRRGRDIWKDNVGESRDAWKDDGLQPDLMETRDIWNDDINALLDEMERMEAASSADQNDEMVDKTLLTIEESPKDIPEVEVDHSLVKPSPLKALRDELNEAYRVKSSDKGKDGANESMIDVGDESNKRLESLIARRRWRKLLNFRKPLMTMIEKIKDPQGQIASINIPKQNAGLHLADVGPFSPPGPGSAPSILVPMRNPFDLPYDPQEEKPDLTGDGFQQEFLPSVSKAEAMFCRHESFSYGGISPTDFGWERDKIPSLDHEVGLGQRYRLFRLGNESGRKVSQPIEEESSKRSKSTSPSDNNDHANDDDHIKEIIHNEEKANDDVLARPDPIPEEHTTATTLGSPSSEEDVKIYKVDKEAILKSLKSMARRHANEVTKNNEDRLVNSRHDEIDRNLVDNEEGKKIGNDPKQDLRVYPSENLTSSISSKVDENVVQDGISRTSESKDTNLPNAIGSDGDEKHSVQIQSQPNVELPSNAELHTGDEDSAINQHSNDDSTFQKPVISSPVISPKGSNNSPISKQEKEQQS